MSFVDWFIASFLYCFPSSFRSSNYCDSSSCRSFSLLKALAKSISNIFAIAFKSENFRESHQKRSKELIHKRMQRGLRVITLQGAIEKSPILLSQYWKFELLGGTIINSYFSGAIIFSPTVCILYIVNFLRNADNVVGDSSIPGKNKLIYNKNVYYVNLHLKDLLTPIIYIN